MNDPARRAVSYIAYITVSGQNPSSIYDNQLGQHFQFSGTADDNVNVFDYDEGCHITGSLSQLFHHGNGNHINISINGTSISGHDYHSGSNFTGNINGSRVSIYDYEHSMHYSYQL